MYGQALVDGPWPGGAGNVDIKGVGVGGGSVENIFSMLRFTPGSCVSSSNILV